MEESVDAQESYFSESLLNVVEEEEEPCSLVDESVASDCHNGLFPSYTIDTKFVAILMQATAFMLLFSAHKTTTLIMVSIEWLTVIWE